MTVVRTASSQEVPTGRGVTTDKEGRTYFSGGAYNRIGAQVFRRSPEGVLEHVAGRQWDEPGLGIAVRDEDGVPAVRASLDAAGSGLGLSVGEWNDLFIADTGNNLIRRVDQGGMIWTVAGNGLPEDSGDGGPATPAGVEGPVDVVAAPDGSLYIATHKAIRRIGPDGIITSLMRSDASSSYCNDGMPADQQYAVNPVQLALSPNGSIYFVESGDTTAYPGVCRIDPDGHTHRVLERSDWSDGGPEWYAKGIAVAGDGRVFVSTSESAVLVISGDQEGDPDVVRYAGEGSEWGPGPDPRCDGVPAAEATLTAPARLHLDAKGDLYVFNANQYGPHLLKVSAQHAPGSSDASHVEQVGDEYVRYLQNGGEERYAATGPLKGFLKRRSDRNGNTVEYTYDAQGRVTRIRYPFDQDYLFDYATPGRVRVTDPAGRDTVLILDGQGDLRQIEGPGGLSTQSFEYEDHLLTRAVRPDGSDTGYTYDPKFKRLQSVQVTEPDGSVLETRGYTAREVKAETCPTCVPGAPDNTECTVDHPCEAATEEATTTKTDGQGNRWEYLLDRFKRVRQVTDPVGHTTSYDRNDRGLVTRVTFPPDDATGKSRHEYYEYDDTGNLTRVEVDWPGPGDEGRATRYEATYERDPDEARLARTRLREVRDGRGQRTFVYDDRSNVARVLDAHGVVQVAYARDALGRITGVWRQPSLEEPQDPDAPAALWTRYCYSEDCSTPGGRFLHHVTDEAGQTWTYEWDEATGHMRRVENPDGSWTEVERDGIGRLWRVKRPTGLADVPYEVTEYGYESSSGCGSCASGGARPTRVVRKRVLADGTEEAVSETRMTYDAAGRLVRVAGPAAPGFDPENPGPEVPVTTYRYDTTGRMTWMQNPAGLHWAWEYWPDGRVRTSTAPGQWPVVHEYRADGLLKEVKSQYRDFEVVDGVLSWLSEEIPSVTTFGHDSHGLVSSVTDALGNASGYMRDGFGRQTAFVDALGKSETYDYDREGVPDGRMWKKTLRSGDTAEYLFYPSGRLKEVRYSDGRKERYEYEAERGLMTRALSIGPDGATAVADYTYGYDEDRRLAAMTEQVMGVGHAYDYDPARGGPNQIATPVRTFALGRDALGRESRVSTGDVEVEVTAFDPSGRPLVEEVRFQGSPVMRVTSTWDTGGRLSSRVVEEAVGDPPEWGALYTLDYQYEGHGYVSSIRATQEQATHVRAYQYDDLGRLVYSTYSTPDHVFEYHHDEAGNRVRSVEDGEMRCYQVGTGNRLLLVDDCIASALTTFAFDDNGAVTQETGGNPDKSLAYDARERMVAASVPEGTWAYEYDHRAWRVMKSGPDGARRYFRDERTLEEDVEVSPGAPPGLALTVQVLFREDGFTPWLMCDEATCRYVLTDHLGTPLKVYEVSWSGVSRARSGLLAPLPRGLSSHRLQTAPVSGPQGMVDPQQASVMGSRRSAPAGAGSRTSNVEGRCVRSVAPAWGFAAPGPRRPAQGPSRRAGGARVGRASRSRPPGRPRPPAVRRGSGGPPGAGRCAGNGRFPATPARGATRPPRARFAGSPPVRPPGPRRAGGGPPGAPGAAGPSPRRMRGARTGPVGSDPRPRLSRGPCGWRSGGGPGPGPA